MSVQDIRINIWVGIYVLSNFHTISEPLLFVGPDQAFTHANTPSVRFQVNAKQINNLYRQYLTAVGRGN